MPKFPSIDQVQLLTPTGMKDGKDNILKLMKILGNPQDTLQVFHVAGSNGKGSVCQMISQTLWKSLGKKVGLFTSPHLVKINERIQIDGVMISDETLDALYEEVIHLSKKHCIELSYFEIQVIAAVLYFTREKVDYAVFEVGLGGTYDGTNIFSSPLACFVTSITLEHTKLLGKTRNSILANKLGIVKPGTRLYTWINNQPIRQYCQKNHISLIGIKVSATEEVTNLPGKHQQRNALLALQSLLDLGFEKKKILEGLQNIENPGRFQWLTPTLLVDTANNTESVKILGKMISQSGEIMKDKKITVVFGTTQEDPAYAAQLASMIPSDKRILIDDFCDRALDLATFAHLVQYDKLVHGVSGLDKILQNSGNITIVYGSLYLIGEIMVLSRYQPFAKG